MKRSLSLLLALVMVLGSFSFTFGAGNIDPAEFLADEGILVGDTNSGDLMLYSPLNRQDAVVILSRLMDEESIARNFEVTSRFPSFIDIKDPYYRPYIGWAEASGYVKGHTGLKEGQFGYNDHLTAREYAVILLRTLNYVEEASDWYSAFNTAENMGLLDSVYVSKDQEILRKEMAQMTYNALETELKNSDKTLAEKLDIDMPDDKSDDFEVVDYGANNLKEVEVSFNQKVDESTVTDSNIKIKDGKRDVAGITTLQEDGKTVVIRVKDGSLTNQKEYKLVVEKVKSDYGLEVDKMEKTFKAFDATLPEVNDIVVTGPRSFEIIFSEPIAKRGTVEVKQDRTKLGNKVGDIGTNRVSVDVYSNLQEGKEYEVTVNNFEDYAEYKNIINTMKFVYEKEIAPPVAEVIKAEQTYAIVEFDKPVKGLKKDYFYHTFNAWNPVGIYEDGDFKTPIKENKTYTRVYLQFYKLNANGKPTSDSRAMPEGTVRFGINGNKIVDNWNNPLGYIEKNIQITADRTDPEITEVEVVQEDLLRIKFNKNVNKPTVDILDEGGRKIKGLTWDVVDNSNKTYDVKLSKNLEGKVITLTVKDVVDTTLMENKMPIYTEYIEIVDRTRPKIVRSYYDIYRDDSKDKDKITGGKLVVIFDEDVDGDTALNYRNYTLVYKDNGKDNIKPLSQDPYFDLNSARVIIPLTASEAKLVLGGSLQVIGVKDLVGNEMVPVVHKLDGEIDGIKSIEVLEIVATSKDRIKIKLADTISNVSDEYFDIKINGKSVDKDYIVINQDEKGGVTELEFILGDKAEKLPTDLKSVVFEYEPITKNGKKYGVVNSFNRVVEKMEFKEGSKLLATNKFKSPILLDNISPEIKKTTIRVDGKDKIVDDIKWIENDKNIYINYSEEINQYALSSLVFKVRNNSVKRVYRDQVNKNMIIVEVQNPLKTTPEITQTYPIEDTHGNEFKVDGSFKATYSDVVYDLTLGGNLSSNPEGKRIKRNTQLVVTVDMPEGKQVKSFMVNEKNKNQELKDNKYTFTIKEDTKINVEFEAVPVKEYTITFNTNGGTEIKSQIVEENKMVTLSEVPTKEGHKFIGWFIDKELKQEFKTDAKVTKDMTLYGRWEEIVPEEIEFGAIQEFISNGTRPRILKDGEDYHLWYRSYNIEDGKTYYKTAKTIEGLKSVENEKVIKIKENEGENDLYLDNFSVVKEGDKFYLFSSDDNTIKVYISDDGINWTLSKEAVFTKGENNAWDSGKIDNPMVIKDGSNYKLYYQGKTENGKYEVGLATSSKIDGPYEADKNNPIVKQDENKENIGLFQPWVVKDGEFYHMWYGAGNGPEAIYHGWSKDGINWVKPDKPIINSESGYYGTPTVFKDENNLWNMLFLEESNGSAKIKYVKEKVE